MLLNEFFQMNLRILFTGKIEFNYRYPHSYEKGGEKFGQVTFQWKLITWVNMFHMECLSYLCHVVD